MHPMPSTHAEQQLAQLANRFDHWRQSRTTRFERIPPPLWEQAILLSQVLPLAQVAKRLRLRGSDLKKRCTAHQTTAARETSPAALDFVEVTATPSWPFPALSTELELHRADGAQLRIRSHEPQFPLAALVRTFLETH